MGVNSEYLSVDLEEMGVRNAALQEIGERREVIGERREVMFGI